MAQIFVSHSRRDEELTQLFLSAFAGTNVRGVFEEIEKIDRGEINRETIARDVQTANAVFVLLGESVQTLGHTRDWICSEAGCARPKDVWVFETRSRLSTISVVIPSVRHYVVLEGGTNDLAYLRAIINSYDDSNVLLGTLAGAALGAAAATALSRKKKKTDDQVAGAALGGFAGLYLADRSKSRPLGRPSRCPKCGSIYGVHIARNPYRCPVCNTMVNIA